MKAERLIRGMRHDFMVCDALRSRSCDLVVYSGNDSPAPAGRMFVSESGRARLQTEIGHAGWQYCAEFMRGGRQGNFTRKNLAAGWKQLVAAAISLVGRNIDLLVNA